jgi:phospholipid transport system transporter-binding protein
MTTSIRLVDDTLQVSGELNAATVPGLLGEAEVLFKQSGEQINIDLAEVTRADSSGLALLIEWMRNARIQNRQLRFLRLPEQMREMARVSGIEALLPLSE